MSCKQMIKRTRLEGRRDKLVEGLCCWGYMLIFWKPSSYGHNTRLSRQLILIDIVVWPRVVFRGI